jgi:hypothetical protein
LTIKIQVFHEETFFSLSDRTTTLIGAFLDQPVLGCFFEAELKLALGCVLKSPRKPLKVLEK